MKEEQKINLHKTLLVASIVTFIFIVFNYNLEELTNFKLIIYVFCIILGFYCFIYIDSYWREKRLHKTTLKANNTPKITLKKRIVPILISFIVSVVFFAFRYIKDGVVFNSNFDWVFIFTLFIINILLALPDPRSKSHIIFLYRVLILYGLMLLLYIFVRFML